LNGLVLIVVSPAKSLDYETPLATRLHSEPEFLDRAEQLIAVMRKKKPAEISRLMSISPALAQLNADRYRDWERPFTPDNARPALLAFNGDVYDGMAAPRTFGESDFEHAQTTLRILSGLYGVLRPLDLMMPYRLEMGTKLKVRRTNDLYGFWGTTLTDALNAAIDASPGDKVLVNLASQEYFGSVQPRRLTAPIVAPAFLDKKDSGDPKIISFFAKKARGVMTAWIIRERITSAEALVEFTGAGYEFDPARSTPNRPVFLR
jgi:uncharacterized protein